MPSASFLKPSRRISLVNGDFDAHLAKIELASLRILFKIGNNQFQFAVPSNVMLTNDI